MRLCTTAFGSLRGEANGNAGGRLGDFGAVSGSGRSNGRLAGQAAGKYTDTPKDNDPGLIDAAPHFEVPVNQVNALKSSDSA
jgi:hypothetical protein